MYTTDPAPGVPRGPCSPGGPFMPTSPFSPSLPSLPGNPGSPSLPSLPLKGSHDSVDTSLGLATSVSLAGREIVLADDPVKKRISATAHVSLSRSSVEKTCV